MSYDSRCYDLAELFLSDSARINDEPHRRALAQHIQTTVENWIEGAEIEKHRDELDDHTISTHGARYD